MEEKAEVGRGIRYANHEGTVMWDQWVADLPNWKDSELASTWLASKRHLTDDVSALPEMYAIAREKIRRWELRKE